MEKKEALKIGMQFFAENDENEENKESENKEPENKEPETKAVTLETLLEKLMYGMDNLNKRLDKLEKNQAEGNTQSLIDGNGRETAPEPETLDDLFDENGNFK